jgi:hypothetical protein
MAVEMTRVGKLPEEKMYTGRCSKCSSEYRAQRKDLEYDSDFREAAYTARCQLTGCSTLVYFSVERSR